jgi:hypothetical protein
MYGELTIRRRSCNWRIGFSMDLLNEVHGELAVRRTFNCNTTWLWR